jgi:flavodoxin
LISPEALVQSSIAMAVSVSTSCHCFGIALASDHAPIDAASSVADASGHSYTGAGQARATTSPSHKPGKPNKGMKALVAYYPMSGNTEKLAKAIHDEASKNHESHIRMVDEVEPKWLNKHDVLFVGSPTHGSNLSAPVKKFLTELPKSPKFKVAAFITHSSPDKAEYKKCFKAFEALGKQKGFKLLGCHDCQTRLAPEIQPYVKEARKASDAEFAEMMRSIDKRPNAADIRSARRFAREIMSRA